MESVFWPRWQVSTRAQVGSKLSSLPSTKLQWMLLWITAGCLFVCLFFTNKQELLAPTFPHLSTTCSHCNSSSHLSINKASGLSPSLACQLHHLGPVGGEDLPVGIVFRTCPQDFLSPLSIGGVNWIPRTVFAKSTDSRITGPAPQPITWISWLGRKAHDSVDSLIGWAGVLGWSWPVSRGACPGGSGGSTVSTSQDTPFTLFLQLYLPAEDRWSWASTCRYVVDNFVHVMNDLQPLSSGSPAADAGAAVTLWAGAWRCAQVPVTQPIGGPAGCSCCC